MQNTSILWIVNRPNQALNPLILAKKIANYATQQGHHSQIIDANEAIPAGTWHKAVLISDTPFKPKADLSEIEHYFLTSQQLNQPLEQAYSHIFDPSNAIQAQQLVEKTTSNTSTKPLRFVAITACPTGVAHTFMAAEALMQGAEKLGYHIDVETQGSVGAKNILSEQAIAEADVVILATDIEVNTDRFVGKKVYRCSTGLALKQTDKAFAQALTDATILAGEKTANASNSSSKSNEKTGFYKHLMTGVSFMLPIVVAGGLLIAMSFVFGIKAFEQEGSLAAALMQTGKAAFTLMIPILSGYIAYSIADRPGLAAGLIGGLLSAQLGAGFLGAIISGFLAGYISLFIAKKVPLPQNLAALKPILIIPLISSLIIGLLMFYVIGTPVADLTKAMEKFLSEMGTTNAILLGAVIGGMMCVDMGGPINKAAYTFSVGLLTLAVPNQFPIAAAMAGGMVPAIGMAIATWLAKNKFSEDERNAGKASFVLGLCFISEGAIPFAAKDPARVLPSCILGGAITGGLVAVFGNTLAAPHGGVFVLLIPNAINNAVTYLIAIAVGSVVTGVTYALLKPKAQLAPAK